METLPVADASDDVSPGGLRHARWWKVAFVPLVLALGLALALIVVMSQIGGSAPNAAPGSLSPSLSPTPSVEPSPSPSASAPLPSPPPMIDPFAFFGEGVERVLTFEGIGPVVLGKSMGEVGEGIELVECGRVESGLPDNFGIELENGFEGNIVRIDVYGPHPPGPIPDPPEMTDGYYPTALTGVRTIHGIEFGDSVDTVSDKLGRRVVIEELVIDYDGITTLFQVTLRESVGGIERVMTINFGEQDQGEPKPELKVRSVQVAFAGHEWAPWHCA